MDYPQSRTLVRELTEITVHPEKHDQSMWARSYSDEVLDAETPTQLTACGTVGCLAGNAVINAGYKLRWENVGWEGHPEWIAHYVVDEDSPDRRGAGIPSVARDLFGLDPAQGDVLFDQDNRLPNMWAQAIDYSNGLISVYDMARAYTERANVQFSNGRKAERDSIVAELTRKTEV